MLWGESLPPQCHGQSPKSKTREAHATRVSSSAWKAVDDLYGDLAAALLGDHDHRWTRGDAVLKVRPAGCGVFKG